MLIITVPAKELYDDAKNEFLYVEETVLELEHSLVALSKWEEEYEKPFLDRNAKTSKEILDYIKCMTVTPNVPPEVFLALSQENVKEITDYFDRKMTATWFSSLPEGRSTGEIITAELIFYWMIGFNIPESYASWNINRLFTLIKVCNAKQQKPKKMTQRELLERQARLNEERRRQYGTSG